MVKHGPSGLYYSSGGSSRNGFLLYVIRNWATQLSTSVLKLDRVHMYSGDWGTHVRLLDAQE